MLNKEIKGFSRDADGGYFHRDDTAEQADILAVKNNSLGKGAIVPGRIKEMTPHFNRLLAERAAATRQGKIAKPGDKPKPDIVLKTPGKTEERKR